MVQTAFQVKIAKCEITPDERKALGALILEALDGEITRETRREILKMDAREIPQPYGHIVGFTNGWMMADYKALAQHLQEEIMQICQERLQENPIDR